MNTHPITGAELQTLREACGLSREELGDLAHVQARTVKHWESGRAGVPADVAELVQGLDDSAQQAAEQACNTIREQINAQQGALPQDLVLLRYNTAQDLARYRPDMAGLPASLHGAIVQRVRLALPFVAGAGTVAAGLVCRVVWMRPEAYEAWRSANRLPDTEATRAAWAAQQIEAQALPHRADQPPA